MMTTLEIPEDVIRRALQVSGAPSLDVVVLKLLQELIAKSDLRDQRQLISLLGTFSDDFYPPGQLEKCREEE